MATSAGAPPTQRSFASVNPIILGNGTPYFPPLAKPLDLRLTESRIPSSRVVYLRYQRMR